MQVLNVYWNTDMSDYLDRLTDDEERAYEIGVRVARAAITGTGSDVCVGCEKPIPVKRRKALPSATRCRDCQEAYEDHARRNANGVRFGTMMTGDDE